MAVYANSAIATLTTQQKQFINAEKSLLAGKHKQFSQIKASLINYPLFGYLEYYEQKKKLKKLSATQLKAFNKKYADTPLSDRLTKKWLKQKGKQKQWSNFLSVYSNQDGTKLRCYYLQALINTKQSTKAWAKVEPLWLKGKSQPKACDPVFNAWIKNGHLTTDLVWQRIALAIKGNNTRLANYLKKHLSTKKDKLFLDQWLKLHRSPIMLSQGKQLASHPRYSLAMKDILLRLNKRHPGIAYKQLATLLKQAKLDIITQLSIRENLAYRLLLDEHDNALAYADKFVSPNEKLADIRLRKAISAQNWPLTSRWIGQLPTKAQTTPRWQYWSARALEKSGDTQAANVLFKAAAKDRGYYGFLAADKIGETYNLSHTELSVAGDSKKHFANKPAIKRITELYALNKNIEARREWYYLTRYLDQETLKIAAKVAHENHWRDRAIFTLAKTGYWEDLELRFPLLYISDVKQQARQTSLDPSWILAVIRQESVFMRDARSHVGATGLMQLMPATAKRVAKRLGQKKPRRTDLEKPKKNIELGSHYLQYVWQQLNKNKVLATAAYNAGPHRVKKWLPIKDMDTDVWIEGIPFKETRSYVKRVMTYTVLYQHRQGEKHQAITDLMGDIRMPIIATSKSPNDQKS